MNFEAHHISFPLTQCTLIQCLLNYLSLNLTLPWIYQPSHLVSATLFHLMCSNMKFHCHNHNRDNLDDPPHNKVYNARFPETQTCWPSAAKNTHINTCLCLLLEKIRKKFYSFAAEPPLKSVINRSMSYIPKRLRRNTISFEFWWLFEIEKLGFWVEQIKNLVSTILNACLGCLLIFISGLDRMNCKHLHIPVLAKMTTLFIVEWIILFKKFNTQNKAQKIKTGTSNIRIFAFFTLSSFLLETQNN